MNSRSYKRRIISANQQTAQSSNTTTHKGEGKLRIVSPASAEEKQKEKQRALEFRERLAKILEDGKKVQKAATVLSQWINGPSKKTKK